MIDVDVILVPADDQGRMDAAAARAHMNDAVFAIVANAGATNCGAVDDLVGLSALTRELGIWLHVDGAYGLAALADPAARHVFDGIEGADSLIVDPHKWLFTSYDSCALVYADARDGAGAHGQSAVYLDALDTNEWNPSEYAIHLTRRARGLPLWYSLACHGTAAYGHAIAQTISIAHEIANRIQHHPNLRLLLGPQLTVILFDVPGMDNAAMDEWSQTRRRSGDIMCLPTTWQGKKVFRLCIVNPETKADEVINVLGTLA